MTSAGPDKKESYLSIRLHGQLPKIQRGVITTYEGDFRQTIRKTHNQINSKDVWETFNITLKKITIYI